MQLNRRIFPTYISEAEALRIKEHKYSGVDHSFISKYVLGRYWNWLVEQVPMWVAPNLLTLAGFVPIVANFIILWLVSPNLEEPQPRWFLLSTAISLFAYQSLDAIDGKQARRTGTAGPLGELFDHGCDALNTGVGGVLGLMALGVGTNWWSIFSLAAFMANFYASTWETYHTGTLYLSQFSGPVEGILASVSAILVAAAVGPQFFMAKLFTILPTPVAVFVPSWLQLNHISAILAVTTSIYNTGAALYNVRQVLSRKAALANGGSPPPKSSASYPTMTPLPVTTLLPLPIFLALLFVWTAAAPTVILSPTAGIFLPFCLGITISSGYQVGLIVLAHCCQSAFPVSSILNTATWAATTAAWGVRSGAVPFPQGWTEESVQAALVWLYLAFTIAVYGYFSWDVIDRLCEVFDIWCLRIKPKGVAGVQANGKTNTKSNGSTPYVEGNRKVLSGSVVADGVSGLSKEHAKKPAKSPSRRKASRS
ncbi:hypothetical protein HDU93_009307 [Gonapodya sp. JEL0774]|nr:hypothetical protein HDU93_009307 [Gonapodya sp. JEL0774]